MGVFKTADGRSLVGIGQQDGNEYNGFAGWRDCVIQLTASGATENSVKYLNAIKDYAIAHNAKGESIMPPNLSIWISNNGVTTAVQADDIAVDGTNVTICGIKWNGTAWDYTDAGKGSGGGGGGDLPSVSWTATVSTGFEAQDVTATVMGNSFTKVSDKAFTYDQIDGAVFAMGGGSIPLDSSMLSDMSAAGVTGTLITLPSPYGPIVFSCTEAGSVVPEPGFYLATPAVSYAPQVTMSYTESLTAETRAIGVGTMEMEDGVTDLPSGVVYLQIEG